MPSEPLREIVSRNLAEVQRRVALACERSGRPAESVRLVAVTKYAELPWVRELVDLGQIDLGESRPQQLVARAVEFPERVQWHLIGHLQRNKAALVLPKVALIHSVDSLRLLDQLEKDARTLDLLRDVLLEVNVSGEASKDGLDPDALLELAEVLRRLEHIGVRGLMTMAPLLDDPEGARPFFRRLRELRDELQRRTGLPLTELSMGMSGDFEPAIEEGATLVRIGSSLFTGLEKD
jgi:PLP dependent protein